MKEKFVFSIISNIFVNIILIIANYILILRLEVVLFGLWVFLNTIFNLGFLLIDIGMDMIHYQYSAKNNFSEYFGTFFTIKTLIVVFNIIITLILITVLQLWKTIFLIYLLFLFFGKIFNEIAKIFVINLKSKIKIFKAFIPHLIINLFKAIFIINLSLNISQIPNPLLYLFILFFIFDFFYVIFILIISKNDLTINKPRKDLTLNYLKDVKPFVFAAIILIITKYLGNLILAYSFGYEELGYFSIVNFYIIPMLSLISVSIIALYLTLFSKYFKNEDFNSVKRLTYIIEKYSSIIFLLSIIIVFLNGELIFSIFLPKYTKSVFILYIMIFIPYLIGVSRPYAYQMIAGKNLKTISIVNSMIYLIIIILMIILIPKYFLNFKLLGLGSIGYAIAQTIPLILWAVLSRYFTNKYYNIKFQKKILLHIPLAFLSLLISLFLKDLITKLFLVNSIFLLISSSLIAILVFVFTLIIGKELKREDLKFLFQILKFQNYIDSFLDEFEISK